MAVFSGFRPFLNKGSTLNGVQNTFFANSVIGAHYLPDAADVYGATGVAAASESIGAVLDEKNGVPTFGPNLIVNGTFDTDLTGWSFNTSGNGTQAVVNGAVSLSSAKNYPTDRAGIFQSLNLTRGTYLLEFDVIERDISFFWAFVGTVYGASDISGNGYSPAVGRAAMVLHIPGGNTWFEWRISGTAKFDNLSLRLVSGNAAIQNTVAARPLFGRAPLVKRNLLIQTEDLSNAAWSKTLATVQTASNNRWKIIPNALTNTSMNVFQSLTSYPGIPQTFTGYFESAGARYVSTRIGNQPNRFAAFILDLTTGSISSAGSGADNISATSVASGSGWFVTFKCTTQVGSNGNPVVFYPSTAAIVLAYNPVCSGNGTDGVIVGQPQLELSSVATAYQRVGAAVDMTETGVTSYSFIRLDLSDDVLTTSNLVSAKNLLRYTQEFDDNFWKAYSAVTVTPNSIIAPDGTLTADTIAANSATTNNGAFQNSTAIPNGSSVSFYAKRGTVGWVAVGTAFTAFTAWFNLDTGTTGSSSNCTTSMINAGNGWWRCCLSNITVGASRMGISPKQSGGTGDSWSVGVNAIGDSIYLWGAQLEIGSAVTDYEYGGFNGTAIVAGRSGTSIDTVTLPNGVFSLGPAIYTGATPGILRAVGDIVGYTLTGRTTTSVEQDTLIDFYKFRGAKGRLITGSELVINGGFNTTDSWTGTSDWIISDGKINVNNGANGGYLGQLGIFIAGKKYLIQLEYNIQVGQIMLATWTSGVAAGTRTFIQRNIAGSTTYKTVFTATNSGSFVISTENTAVTTCWIDNVSIKELRPKEEW